MMGVLIPSVSCLRGTHETAPLDQQGEPLRRAGTRKLPPEEPEPKLFLACEYTHTFSFWDDEGIVPYRC